MCTCCCTPPPLALPWHGSWQLWVTPILFYELQFCKKMKNEAKMRLRGEQGGDKVWCEHAQKCNAIAMQSLVLLENSWFANAFFTKEPNKTSQRLFGSLLENFFLHEDGSVLGFPPNTGLTGKLCVRVRQNVAKWRDFWRIFDIQHFADIFPICQQHVQLSFCPHLCLNLQSQLFFI